ncbi:MAG: hypothetical protein JSV55_09455 [Deltaproteobacteria bacterium]|nr:MAG: hypothetical protein JSV40_09770 [Deltaproteobacteria bacterium]UCH06342.1 MAG: hypothetical protein JSV55_09455 [Deltaproteobacteria bacterium]
MTKQYRVVLLGFKDDADAFRDNMAKLGVAYDTLDKYIRKAPIVLKRDLDLADARRYADAIINAGGFVNIQETGEFPETPSPADNRPNLPDPDYVLCPNCGFKQKKEDCCVRCGFDLDISD